jgi:hypothetical protein
VRGFFDRVEMRALAEFGGIRTHLVSTYIETLTRAILLGNAIMPCIRPVGGSLTIYTYVSVELSWFLTKRAIQNFTKKDKKSLCAGFKAVRTLLLI